MKTRCAVRLCRRYGGTASYLGLLRSRRNEAVRSGKIIRVTVAGTRRNLFGQLHYAPRFYEACEPGCFVTEGDDRTNNYALIDSGLHGITLTKYRANK